jgi:tetratricopeptide (TPR) repeat protein
MTKKAAQKVKGSSSKMKKDKALTQMSAKPKAPAPKNPVKPAAKPDPRYTQAVQNFEAAMKALQGQKFDKAKALLEKVLEGPSRELADRARMYMNVCNQQLSKSSTSFKTSEEHYDYAVALINGGNFVDARTHLEKILKQNPKADYATYGLAVLDCLTNRTEEALRNLQQAIKLNPNNRFQARNDSDFNTMADDPRFTELIYPEPGEYEAAVAEGNAPQKKR